MTSENSIDEQKLAEAALAILSLTLHSSSRGKSCLERHELGSVGCALQKRLDLRPCWKEKIRRLHRGW